MSTVLIVDDDRTLAERIRSFLPDPAGAVIHTDIALGVPQGSWRMAIVDLHLGSGNTGLAVIARLRQRQPSLRIVAMTGMPDAGFYLELARRAGADALLRKPFDAAALAALL
ncbi:MAG: Response regulator receiver domain [Planctomycetota bacterium]|jgi:ActR/RegA family two-component response regulator